jgi:hypothetical protein
VIYLARQLLAPAARLAFPQYSTCKRCGMPWGCVRPHSVALSVNRGCFAICEDCWGETDVNERLIYFATAHAMHWPSKDWADVRAAVLAASVPA